MPFNARYASPLARLFLLGLLLNGCDRAATAPVGGLPTVAMKVGGKTYTLEVAAKEPFREHGLMDRDSMPGDHGMIFAFDGDTNEGFWMKNTRIPLDIVFLDSHGEVVSVRTMKPFDEHTTYAEGPYRYAIELNAGAAADCGVKSGDSLVVPNTVDAALK